MAHRWVVNQKSSDKGTHFCWIIQVVHQFLDGARISQAFKSIRLVLRKGVVHVKSDCFNAFHIQWPIAKNLLARIKRPCPPATAPQKLPIFCNNWSPIATSSVGLHLRSKQGPFGLALAVPVITYNAALAYSVDELMILHPLWDSMILKVTYKPTTRCSPRL